MPVRLRACACRSPGRRPERRWRRRRAVGCARCGPAGWGRPRVQQPLGGVGARKPRRQVQRRLSWNTAAGREGRGTDGETARQERRERRGERGEAGETGETGDRKTGETGETGETGSETGGEIGGETGDRRDRRDRGNRRHRQTAGETGETAGDRGDSRIQETGGKTGETGATAGGTAGETEDSGRDMDKSRPTDSKSTLLSYTSCCARHTERGSGRAVRTCAVGASVDLGALAQQVGDDGRRAVLTPVVRAQHPAERRDHQRRQAVCTHTHSKRVLPDTQYRRALHTAQATITGQ